MQLFIGLFAIDEIQTVHYNPTVRFRQPSSTLAWPAVFMRLALDHHNFKGKNNVTLTI